MRRLVLVGPVTHTGSSSCPAGQAAAVTQPNGSAVGESVQTQPAVTSGTITQRLTTAPLLLFDSYFTFQVGTFVAASWQKLSH